MSQDLWSLYGWMYKSRVFEEQVRRIWKDGSISGEMHLGMGEEGIAAGILFNLVEGDALALDHRGTPPLVMRGVDPISLLREFLGRPDGLCGGMGGHMHLFVPEKLAASSGIVGAAGPAAVGFALSAQMLRPGRVSIAFFGEGATGAGMLMESMNLAVVWKLPVVFVCKNNDWEITTPAVTAVGGSLLERARASGLAAFEVDGSDVLAVQAVAQQALGHARTGQGPAFILAHCIHLEGHFLGDALLDMFRKPIPSLRKRLWPMLRGFFRAGGASLAERMASLRQMLVTAVRARSQMDRRRDPLVRARGILDRKDRTRLVNLEDSIQREIQQGIETAFQPGAGGA